MSITGLLCVGAAAAAVSYLVVVLVFGKRIAVKAFRVIMMSPDEHSSLQEKVQQIAQKIGTPAPKVGLIEDLRPNAFTLGYGRNAVIVFSLGILKLLDDEELVAVASHELAHIKLKDYLFRSLSYTLNILSFFNPLSYFAVSEAQKQRELLADEKGAALLNQPNLMANVLIKLEKVLKVFPKERFANRLSASLFLVSPLARRTDLLAAHPHIAHRVYNIHRATSKTMPRQPNFKAVIAVSLILIIAALTTSYCMITLQTSFQQKDHLLVLRTGGANGQPTQVLINATNNLPFPSLDALPVPISPNVLPTLQGNITTIAPDGRAIILNNTTLTRLP